MKVGFTGTRHGMDTRQVRLLRTLLMQLPHADAEFHHGDCVGADEQAHRIARELGYRIIIHPPLNPKHRAHCAGDEILDERDYIDRNHRIVDQTDLLIAAPQSVREVLHSGTWATIRHARKTNKRIHVLNRSGDEP